MEIQGIFTPILKIAMIAVRVSALWMFFPVFGHSSIPAVVRLSGILTISVALYNLAGPKLPAWSLEQLPSTAAIVEFTVREFLLGLGMGLVARWIYSAVVASAHWISTQLGFSAGGLFDPETQTPETPWSEFHQWLAVMVFFSIGGHLLFIQALAESYTLDLGLFFTRITDPSMGSAFWIEVGTRFFTWMLRLAAPMMVVLLILQIAMGVLSKFVPQINIFSVSIPATIGIGVLVFTMLSPLYGDALTALFSVNVETNYLWLRFVGGR